MIRSRHYAMFGVLLFLGCASLGAAMQVDDDATSEQPAGQTQTTDAESATTDDRVSVTHHTVMIDGEEIAYTASAGYMTLPDYKGKARADIFYVAYMREDTGDEGPSTRPITFAYNGGPGSASVWLHLGALGPRRVDMGEEGFAPKPPYILVPNDSSWIDFTDLVFIDPVSTGYSRPAEGEDPNQFHGLEEDISSVGDFIRLWTTKNARWLSPKFLAGESYGTTRNAGISSYLQSTHGMYLNGIVMISTVLNFETVRFGQGNDTPYWLFLPTYAATAWYHDKLDPELQAMALPDFLAEVKQFAQGDYLHALALGDTLSKDDRAAIAAQIARYTGLREKYVLQSDLRIRISRFTKELLRDKNVIVGRLDSRISARDSDQQGQSPDFDPSMAAITGPYTALFNDYVRRELEYKNDLPYEILTGRVHPWSYSSATNQYVNVAPRLRNAMLQNRNLNVFFANGYYDLATPFFATEYTIAHLGIDPDLQANIDTAYFQAGHMMYIRVVELARLKARVQAFYARALSSPAAAQPE